MGVISLVKNQIKLVTQKFNKPILTKRHYGNKNI